MIRALVFSRDRALQLDACLRSYARHVADAEAARVHVIYRASSDSLERQYQELAALHKGTVRFFPEFDFRAQVLDILGMTRPYGIQKAAPWRPSSMWWRVGRGARLDAREQDFVLFLVDDTLFVRKVNLGMVAAALQTNADAVGFSLRLGRNTVENYALGRAQQLPDFQVLGHGVLKYDWKTADGDFGYPLEISSSVYRLLDIAPLISSLRFRDPNTLESGLSLQAKGLARRMHALLCPEYSVAFCAPLNRVQKVFENRAGQAPEWSPGRLADKFDEGFRVDVAALDGFLPSGCHQELELPLEPRTAPPSH
jgi:hypothetical protein